jgi:intraflagellar transport protein 88
MDHALIMAGQLVAPVIEKDVPTGFDWVVDTLRSSNCNDLANDMEIAKALNCIYSSRWVRDEEERDGRLTKVDMKHKDFEKAIETLKAFEKKDQKMVGTASTNLSFLYLWNFLCCFILFSVFLTFWGIF